MTHPLERLPFEPLRAYLAARTVLGVNGGKEMGIAALGWKQNMWQARAFDRAQREGSLTYFAADRLACDLNVHPCHIWGDSWWDNTQRAVS